MKNTQTDKSKNIIANQKAEEAGDAPTLTSKSAPCLPYGGVCNLSFSDVVYKLIEGNDVIPQKEYIPAKKKDYDVIKKNNETLLFHSLFEEQYT